jgi:hypothetical protein
VAARATLQKRGGVVQVVVSARIHAVASAPPPLCSSSINAWVHTHREHAELHSAVARRPPIRAFRDCCRRPQDARAVMDAGPAGRGADGQALLLHAVNMNLAAVRCGAAGEHLGGDAWRSRTACRPDERQTEAIAAMPLATATATPVLMR